MKLVGSLPQARDPFCLRYIYIRVVFFVVSLVYIEVKPSARTTHLA
jgi:hypothetical protein